MTAPHDLLVVGRVRNAHGLRGDLAVEILTDEPGAVFAPGRRVFAGSRHNPPQPAAEWHVESSSPFKGGLLLRFRELADRTAAERWRHRFLLVPVGELSPLEEGEVYHHELPGMLVELGDGTSVGEVVASYELPQGLVMEVARPQGSVMIPFNEDVVTRVDRDGRRLVVAPPDGLLD